jgi:hypothetical protein
MLAATLFGIFFIPSLFVFIERLMGLGARRRVERRARAEGEAAPGRR